MRQHLKIIHICPVFVDVCYHFGVGFSVSFAYLLANGLWLGKQAMSTHVASYCLAVDSTQVLFSELVLYPAVALFRLYGCQINVIIVVFFWLGLAWG